MPPSLQRLKREGHIQSWHPGQKSVFSTEKGWAPRSLYHPQKHLPGDCEAHKAVLLGDLETDYKFTGDNQGI